MRFIYDLDHTVIDSSHRQLTLSDGSLDLAHWIENNTRERIMRDALLPLANHWREQRNRGAEIVVCTARVIGQADIDFLYNHGLHFHALLSRPNGNNTADAILKEQLLREYAYDLGVTWRRFCMFSVMIDDNESVINRLRSIGLSCHNALTLNAMAKGAA